MNAPAKFLFEDDFAANAKPAKPMVSLAAHQSALARAEEDGHRNGMAAAEAQIAGRTAAACDRIAQGLAPAVQSNMGLGRRAGVRDRICRDKSRDHGKAMRSRYVGSAAPLPA